MKKVFLFAILLGIATSNAFAQSPRLIKKELKESNSYFQKKDGYTLKYYVYTYLSKEDTLYAAYNLKGKRITPISKKVYYCGAGIFSVKDSPNGYIKGYNTNGELLFPATLKATSIQHNGGEMMLLWFNNDNAPKGQTFALYSSKGKCIIPESMKYDEIIYYYEPPQKYILCEYLEKYGNNIQIKICRVYTPDGQWFQEGSYDTYYKRYDLGSTASVGSSEFEFFKRPVSEAIVRSSIDQSRKIEAYESRMASDGNSSKKHDDLMEIYNRTSESNNNNNSNSNNSTNSNSKQGSKNNTNNNSYNNSYNNNSQSAPRQCNLCRGSGRCCGAGNVAYANQYCNGTGRCNPCGGSGLLTNSFTGQKMNCTYCNGTGRCLQCSGSGRCGHCGGSGQQR